MFLVPTNILRSLAAGAIIVGAVSVAAALTLLPAILTIMGDRINALRLPVVGRNLGHADAGEARIWRSVIGQVMRRPAASLTLAAGFMALLAGDPRFGPGVLQGSADGSIQTLTEPIRGDATSNQDVAAIHDLRQQLIPASFAGSGTKVLVGGTTADTADYFHAVTAPTPYALAFVLGLSFVLLLVAFRSLTISLVSVFLNLLSVGAAYGLLTLVFIHGFGAGIFGFSRIGHIDAWVPLFLFSVLFALSMDYQVLLISRIKERYDQTGSTRDAITTGVASTARIITGAALIIVVVFSGFARGKLVMFQQMGFGVAVALLLDATVVRVVILPSILGLLGHRSWYLPRWLGWVPRLQVESSPAPSTR